MSLTAVIVDGITNSESIKTLTAGEAAQLEADRQAAQEYVAQREAAEAERQAARQSAIAKLAALGLTEEEAQAVIGE